MCSAGQCCCFGACGNEDSSCKGEHGSFIVIAVLLNVDTVNHLKFLKSNVDDTQCCEGSIKKFFQKH